MSTKINEHFTSLKLFKFTIPTILTMILISVYGVIDGIFVSNLLGNDAFVGVNLAFPFIMVFSGIGFMVGTGGSALCSKLMGENKKEKANEVFTMLIVALFLAGIVVGLIGYFSIRQVMILEGAEGVILEHAVTYAKIWFLGFPFFMLQNAFGPYFIASNRPDLGLKFSFTSGIINMALDYIFMAPSLCNFGVAGGAIACVIGQIVGDLIPLWYFSFGKERKLFFAKFSWDFKSMLDACINGSSEMLSNISMSLANFLFNMQLMKYYGTDGVTAFSIIMYVGFIFVGVYVGFATGTIPIIGYNYGSENKEELSNVFRKSMKTILTCSFTLTFLCEISAPILAMPFTNGNQELWEFSIQAIRLYSISYLISGINIYASSFFTGLNNGFISALISTLRTLVFNVAMIYILPSLFGKEALWLTVTVAEILTMFITIACLLNHKERYGYSMHKKKKAIEA